MTSNTKLSKKLSWLLRHGADEAGIKLSNNGWANLEDILRLPNFARNTKKDIIVVVQNCPKQRFSLKEEEGKTFIKACQGHSIKEIDFELTPILSAESQPFAYHGTYLKVWPKIKLEGLSRMNRVHIHFSPSMPKSAEETSGIRKNCQIIIEVDIAKLLAANFKIFQSENNVILTEGNEKGFIPPEFFSKAIERKTGKNLL
ncbi:UNVERIFIED_CONTAM: hypothetical protein RMT77_005376 [Armadillidium vulgare]